MLCVLAKNHNLTVVHGRPQVFLDNKTFYRMLQNPDIAIKIIEYLGVDSVNDGLLIGKLGICHDGVYVEDTEAMDIVKNPDKKEMCFYESIQ